MWEKISLPGDCKDFNHNEQLTVDERRHRAAMTDRRPLVQLRNPQDWDAVLPVTPYTRGTSRVKCRKNDLTPMLRIIMMYCLTSGSATLYWTNDCLPQVENEELYPVQYENIRVFVSFEILFTYLMCRFFFIYFFLVLICFIACGHFHLRLSTLYFTADLV